jgi:hypothetical protein
MTAESWLFDTNILVYLFDEKTPDRQATARSLWERACREATPLSQHPGTPAVLCDRYQGGQTRLAGSDGA